MRIVHGMAAGMELMDRRPGYTEPQLSPAALKRNREIFGEPLSASDAVRRIVASVRELGDDAVREFARIFDDAAIESLEVPRERLMEAADSLPSDLRDALETAASRIMAYHAASMPQPWSDAGAGYGVRIVPIERVGLYVPGGTAQYPSTVLMSAIPAKTAGVPEVILCTPTPSPVTLAAAHIAGVDRLFQIGGAQAIAAMAFGTGSVPRVDKICGPGNMFVSIAKREVYGQVDIDGLYGPTETIVIADDSADPELAAADLLAQAEHDELASPMLITTGLDVAERVASEVERQIATLSRGPIARAAVDAQGAVIVVDTVAEAIELANAYAPEHLCLLVRDAASFTGLVRNAGGIFVGEHSPEVIGDYVAGPSHVMPTGGTARFTSSLGVQAFLRHIPVIALDGETLNQVGPAAAAIARAEGLTGHAHAIELRLEGLGVDKDSFREAP
jgi:histidinol dehydrogenase